MPREESGSRFHRVVVGCALFAAAFLVRILSWPLVLRASGVQPAGSDAFYHLRRIAYSVENFPSMLGRDAYLNFPHGGEPIWSPAFDWLLALLGWALVGPGDQDGLERLLVWVPPLLGGATVVLLYRLAVRHFSERVALLAALLLCVLPAHVLYSRIGALDHHVAVVLCAAWILSAALRLFELSPSGFSPNAREWKVAGWLGVALGVALLVWPGALMHVAALQVALLWRLLTASERDSAIAWARLAAACQAVAALVVLPFAAGSHWEVWGSFSPVVLSNFQPIYLGAAALCSAAMAEVWLRIGFPDSFALRLGQALALGGVAAGLALIGLPSLGSAGLDAWSWFTKAESFQATVAESAPLFWRGSGWEGARAEQLLSRGIYLVPFAIAALVWSRRGARLQARTALVLCFAASFFVATLTQRRFMNSFSLFYALLLALALERLLGWLRRRLPDLRGLPVLLGLAIALLAYPMLGWYSNEAANLVRLARGEPVQAFGTELVHATLLPVASWLRGHSAETVGYFDASAEPEYGLLSAWGDGHLLLYVARRPTVQGNFGNDVGDYNFELAERYFSSRRERDAIELLRQVRARYVVVRSSGSGHASLGYKAGSVWSRLYLPVRAAAEGRGARDDVPELSLVQHRLIHESKPPPAESPKYPFYAVYERVEGARAVGRAAPGSLVEARLALKTTNGAALRFTTGALAGADGRYRLILPYANEPAASTVKASQRYLIRNGSEQAWVAVSEAAVQAGLEVPGPDFGASGQDGRGEP